MMKVDALAVEGCILIGAILYLSRIVWHQRRAIEALQSDRLSIENRRCSRTDCSRSIENRLGTFR
jgi:hypothetical protein